MKIDSQPSSVSFFPEDDGRDKCIMGKVDLKDDIINLRSDGRASSP